MIKQYGTDEDEMSEDSEDEVHIDMDVMLNDEPTDPESLLLTPVTSEQDHKRRSDGTTATNSSLAIAVGETRAVVCLRVVIALVLLGVALGVSLSVYLHTQQTETDNFHQQFQDNALKLIGSFRLNAERRVGAIDSLATMITSHMLDSPFDFWPLITMPHFERRASFTLDQAQVISLMLLPLVTQDTRDQWETYATYKQGWLQESLAYQEEEGLVEAALAAQDEEALETVGQIGDGIQNKGINPHIWRLNGLKAGEETGKGPYLPIWQHSPAIPVSDALNLNLLSHPAFAHQCYTVLRRQESLIGKALDFSDETNPMVAGRKAILNLYLNRWKGGGNAYEDGPVSDLYVPIFDRFDDQNKTLVALMVANVYWQVQFEDILAENVRGMVAVLENTCDQAFTYEINGQTARFLGAGDLSDPKYAYLEESTGFGAYLHTEGTVEEPHCAYNVRIYPSQQFEDDHRTRTPMIFAVSLAFVFVFTSLVFLTYDRCVERRQKVVLDTAEKTSAVVASLFPEQVQERLFQQQTKSNEFGGDGSMDVSSVFGRQRRRWNSNTVPGPTALVRRNSNNSLNTNGSLFHDMPIADLYQHTTIFFADIAGFTKWSATHEPTEVFKLLESLYAAFDEAAVRLDVFKVETIGDCYVAATGLPAPQLLHAVIMSRFAALCLLKCAHVCHHMVPILGKETSKLGLRVGMHSGSVTAGVLRGAKSRFQLFGDTVNTASRMESTGVVGRIQATQQTADLLIGAGKGDWVRPREDSVVAKGKGRLRTHWVEPKLDAVDKGRGTCTFPGCPCSGLNAKPFVKKLGSLPPLPPLLPMEKYTRQKSADSAAKRRDSF